MTIAIIGGGAAGLMAAATIRTARTDVEVLLIERNDALGKKVVISGGGRCNVTTGIRDVRRLLTNYPRGGKFLTSAMYGFPPGAVYDWFEAHGVPLKTQEDDRVFPRSDDGHDIVGVFERFFRENDVRVFLKTAVTGVHKDEDGRFVISVKNGQDLTADRVILTTGGQAYRHTGSTGDGYAFAMSLGHSLTPLAPSLNSFTTKERWPADVSGVSFARARIVSDRNRAFTYTGPFLFTHRGVSGPAVFALSSLVAFETYDAEHPLRITIDLFPDASIGDLEERFTALRTVSPTRSARNLLSGLVPRSVAERCIEEVSVDGDKNGADLSKKDVSAIVGWCKGIPLTVIGRGAGDEFVTAGGIPTSEIDPSTMESRICPGLFFAGEIMDVDGFTGGFNLQASWAAGRLAGLHAAA